MGQGSARTGALDAVDQMLDGLPSLLTLEEAAALMRLSPDGYRQACLQGRAPGSRYPAGGWRILRSELAEYLRGNWAQGVGAHAEENGEG